MPLLQDTIYSYRTMIKHCDPVTNRMELTVLLCLTGGDTQLDTN